MPIDPTRKATGRAMALTVIGIPLAPANLTRIPVSLMPLGKEIAPVAQPHPGRSLPALH
jgi:uncharacterized membrane protein YccF (DUF307 family)